MGELFWMVYMMISGALLLLNNRIFSREWLLKWILVSIFPVVGWLFPVFWPKLWLQKKDLETLEKLIEMDDEPDLQTSGLYMNLERHKELNVVSVEEALIVSDHSDRRAVMIDVLKQDVMKYMDILQTAVSNEDTETSHYAVSAIMEIKRKLTLSLQQLSVEYEVNKEDANIVSDYAEVLKGYMQSGFLDARTLRKYQFTYLLVLEQLILITPNNEAAYTEKINTELDLGDFQTAENTALTNLKEHPDSEEAYLSLLKVYFYMKSYLKIQETVDSIKRSPLRLSNRALTLVRFWSEGA
ncbi:hypothetical protein [Paenibacillus dakarensis]|uniref:hypothetical protein n=1 Tax=Paenibacillus dakarensis TaxID=1527293 RepID=UPI0006D5596D|nr:hypothetical protein [Paenibacillus dakarensis]